MCKKNISLAILIAATCAVCHATTVISVSDPTSIVLAGDGLVTYTTGNGLVGKNLDGTKIAVCGSGWLLCGFAGIGPMVFNEKGLKVEYDFQPWIAGVNAGDHPSVLEFAKAIQAKSRVTFRDMESYIKGDDFWKEYVSKMAFLETFQVVGYTNGIAQRCNISIRLIRDKRTLDYWEPECKNIEWTGTKVHISTLTGSLADNIARAVVIGTPQQMREVQLEREVMGRVRFLALYAPPSTQADIALAYAMVKVESEFDPEHVGGTISIGYITKDARPVIIRFPPVT